jgi:hypothetical protein
MEQENVNIVIKQKRGRKPKNKDAVVVVPQINELENTIQIENVVSEEQKPKKRGRKPKGGKIVQQSTLIEKKEEEKMNIILHLKCSLEDLEKNKHIDNSVNSFSFQHDNDLQLHLMKGVTNVNEFSDNNSLFINVT